MIIKYDRDSHDRSKLDILNNTLYILILNLFISDILYMIVSR